MLALALLALAPLRFHYDASEFTNTVYHVNCLTGRVSCTDSLYSGFWNERYNVTPEDGAQLNAWQEIVRRMEGAAPTPPPAPTIPNYGGFYPALNARYRIITTALEAGSAKEFRKRAATFLVPADAARLSVVLNHFHRRLHPWWISAGKAAVEEHMRQVERRMNADKMSSLATEVAAFVETGWSTRDVYIHAIPSPEPRSKNASATVVRNHFFVEIVADDKPEYTVWKAMHELTHAFYDAAPPARHLELMATAVASPEPGSTILYTFLNEGVATGVQLLLYERLGLKDDDPYNDPFIPRIANAILPLLKQSWATRQTLFGGFAPAYFRVSSEALKDVRQKPAFLLSATAVLASQKNQPAHDQFLKIFQPRAYLTKEDEWKLYPEFNAVRLLTYDELGPYIPQLPEGLMDTRGFAYVLPHGKKSYVFLLAGRNVEAASEVIQRLAKAESIPPAGLIFSLDGPGTSATTPHPKVARN